MNKMLSCYRFYTAKNQRISAFAREKEGKLEIFLERCSKKDSFHKLTGKTVGSYWFKNGIDAFKTLYGKLYNPEVVEVKISEGNTPQYEFMKYLNNNFFKKKERVIKFNQEILQSGETIIPLRTLKQNYKW